MPSRKVQHAKTINGCTFHSQKMLRQCRTKTNAPQVFRLNGVKAAYGNGSCDGFSPNLPLIPFMGAARF